LGSMGPMSSANRLASSLLAVSVLAVFFAVMVAP